MTKYNNQRPLPLSSHFFVRKEENSGIQCARFDFKTGSYVAQADLRLALWRG